MESGNHFCHLVFCAQPVDFGKLFLDRRIPVFIQLHTVHPHRKQHTDLLPYATFRLRLGTQSLDKGTDLFLIVITQLVESSKACIFRFQRIVLHPAATGILVKIGTRSYGRIQVCQIDCVIFSSLLHRSFAASYHCNHSGCNKRYRH